MSTFPMSRCLAGLALLLGLLAAGPAPRAQDTLSAAAVVNDEVISMLDLAMRARLAVLASGQPVTPANMDRVQPQVLRTLIDERIQIQEAKRLDISVSDEQIDAAFVHIARQNNMSPEQFAATLQRNSILPSALRDQLRAGMVWDSVVRRRLRSTITISEEEVDEVVARIINSRDKPEVHLAEIFLAVDNVLQEDDVRAEADRLFAQLRGGARFDALARQFSEAATASVGGDLGWLRVSQLPEELAQAVDKLRPGQIAGPVRTLSGFYIIYLQEERQAAATNDATVSLKQILFPLAPGAAADQIERAREAAQEARRDISSCETAQEVAEDVGAPGSGDLGTLSITDLPDQVRDIVTRLPIGVPSEPVRLSEAMGVLVVCARGDASIDRERIRERLTDSRLELLARRYLRDLRRAANIEVRI
jgi:peptidyl-prolyl cis-trans isomerase SurA